MFHDIHTKHKLGLVWWTWIKTQFGSEISKKMLAKDISQEQFDNASDDDDVLEIVGESNEFKIQSSRFPKIGNVISKSKCRSRPLNSSVCGNGMLIIRVTILLV